MIRKYAYKLLERFVYSEAVLREKLLRKFPENFVEAHMVLDELKSLGFIDDKKNGEYYAELLASRGYGRLYIKRYLQRKRLPVPESFETLGEEAMERWFLKKSKGQSKLDKRGLQKMFFYLKSKGFGTSEIMEFLRKRGVYEGE